ncbi:MAG: Holliday junction branch migration protein RuvA [Bacteroidales bacterium OttesenSCG-928-I14]|jgi:Holliday junction DNA helicase RuvA|nr:Holliday junction branch migration protein RuvA [Bacteroidales bacterium OttesenSCG-928-I14]
MIDFIKGEIIEITPTSVVIETGNIGYMLAISLNTYSSLSKSNSCKLYVYEHIKEDTHQLFGFINKQERQLFIYLISVSGIGSCTARMILSSLSVYELKKIIFSSDVSALKAIKGIGNKTAERIIVDLKDKITLVNEQNHLDPTNHNNTISDNILNEVVSALVTLGFSQRTSKQAASKIMNNNSNLTAEQIIKSALKFL